MRRTFLIILAFLMLFTIMRFTSPLNEDSEYRSVQYYYDLLVEYEFSFEGTVEHWQELQEKKENMPQIGGIEEPDPCEGFSDVLAYLGRCISWVYETVLTFFKWCGSALGLVGNFIATIYYVVVDLATNIVNVLSIVAAFCGIPL